MKLEARRRVGLGKGAGRRIRSNGMIPAVLYGAGGETVNLAVQPKAVKQILQSPGGRNTIFSLEVDGGESVPMAIVTDFQKHPLRRELLHCDILRLDPTKRRKFLVPFVIKGTSPAEKAGAKVRFVTRNVHVRCTPDVTPEILEVDVTGVEMGDVIRLSDVETPDGVELVYNQNAPVFVAAGSVQVFEDEDEEGEGGDEGTEGAESAETSED